MKFFAFALLLTLLSGCHTHIQQNTSPAKYSTACITEQEVVTAQKAWGNGIVRIGQAFANGGDYTKAAADHINRFYAYDLSLVLFKPTLASVDQFRASFDGALSYFVGGNPSYTEDKGFALKPWTADGKMQASLTTAAQWLLQWATIISRQHKVMKSKSNTPLVILKTKKVT